VWQKNGPGGEHRYSIHTKTVNGGEHRKVIGGIPSSAPRARFGGPSPAGPGVGAVVNGFHESVSLCASSGFSPTERVPPDSMNSLASLSTGVFR
jgi:hypothetical protein